MMCYAVMESIPELIRISTRINTPTSKNYMEHETLDVIEVQATSIDSSTEAAIPRWYSAAQVQNTLNLNKTALQKAVVKLQNIYGIDLASLRRGSARATEYSEFALEAIELLNTKKLSELRQLVEKSASVAEASAPTSAIVFVGEHNQIAVNASTVAEANLAQINSIKSGLLNSYRELGRAMGKQAVAEVRMGFTEEVKAGLADLQEA